MRPSFAFACALLLATCLAARPAAAFFHITTVACDTVGTNPLMVRTTFTVDLVGPGGYNWFDVVPRPAGPLPADSTHFDAAVAPAGWDVFPVGPPGAMFEFLPHDRQGFSTGAHIAGFQLITNRAGPCARFAFETGLLDNSGDAVGEGCLILDGPVPAAATTWGQLKAVYRK